MAVSLAEEQRRRGHSAVALCFDDMLHRQYGGMMINYSKVTAFRGEYKIHPLWWLDRRRMYRILEKSDMWHYHYPHGRLKADLFSRAKGRSILKHYHGEQRRLSAAGLRYVEKHDTPRVCQLLERCYTRL